MKLEQFVAINAAAAAAAAMALGRMTQRPAAVKMSNARLIQLSSERPAIDLEGRVAGVFLEICGGLKGAALLCFSEERARALIDLVVGSPDVSRRSAELDESAFKELGNIICGNYVTEFSNHMKVKITPGLPGFARGTFMDVCERVIALHSLDAHWALVVDVELELPSGTSMGHLLLCFESGLDIEIP